MNKLMLGFPLYHQLPSRFFARYLAMTGTNVHGFVVSDGVYLPIAMQKIVDEALAVTGWDRLLIMEHDTIPPTDAFERVGLYEPEHDIVGSLYFRHEPPHDPLCYIQEETSIQHNPLTPGTVKSWVESPALYECSAVGFGFTSIARHVLENWDKSKAPMFKCDGAFASHDLWFCYHARQQGFKVYLDTGVLCDHLTEVPISYGHNQACAPMIAGRPHINFGQKKVLNVGAGGIKPEGYTGWRVDSLDINPDVAATFQMDARDLEAKGPEDGSYDAVYCSHALEHFSDVDVPRVLRGFKRVLKPGGLAHIKVPDIDAITGKAPDEVLYVSPVGPITPTDILVGHQNSIAAGNTWMRHLSRFNHFALDHALTQAGFGNVTIQRNPFELEARAQA